MIEKVNHVSNPLTVIAIFAGLAEVAGSIALVAVDPSIQSTFVWFVMFFPIGLVVLFFATLNFNPRVLYAPSDFKDEENFLSALAGKQKVEKQFGEVFKQIERTQRKLIESTLAEVGKEQDPTSQEELKQAIESQLDKIREKLDQTKVTADEYVVSSVFPQSHLQSRILEQVAGSEDGVTAGELSAELGMSTQAVARALHRLLDRGLLVRSGLARLSRYNINKETQQDGAGNA
ncbi:MAG: helix-turn-helix domain-containing protein [Verrucomicrobiales bacterium]